MLLLLDMNLDEEDNVVAEMSALVEPCCIMIADIGGPSNFCLLVEMQQKWAESLSLG